MELSAEVSEHIKAIIDLVKSQDDPATRFILCDDVHQQLQAAIMLNGPRGLRGNAARQLKAECKTWAAAARRVNDAGGNTTTIIMKRVAEL